MIQRNQNIKSTKSALDSQFSHAALQLPHTLHLSHTALYDIAMSPDLETSPSFQQELAQAQHEMRDRMDRYVAAWMSADLETILSYFVDEGLDYSDYGLMALHMDKTALIAYFQFMGTAFGDMDIQTKGAHGARVFCVWECTFEFTVLRDIPAVPYERGARGKLFWASTTHWNKEEKIYREDDYAVCEWLCAVGQSCVRSADVNRGECG
ncbi:hypothetical protein BJ170DRAFT_638487 [Xylariales sp. AK1849]|nr:hypothetical protein BJ170DRAFT_638487 [Xylariales sp. AK1849]